MLVETVIRRLTINISLGFLTCIKELAAIVTVVTGLMTSHFKSFLGR
jgi:hypothetical protein